MTCPVCGTNTQRVPGGIVRCPVCGLGSLPPTDLAARVAELSARGYSAEEAYAPIEDADHKFRVARQVLKAFNAFHGRGDVLAAPKGTVLEVGFGNAAILEEFARRGWKTYGIDQSSAAVDGAVDRKLGHVVRAGFDTGARLEDGSYAWMDGDPAAGGARLSIPLGSCDLIIGWDAFEHFQDLKAAFLISARLLKPNGVLAIHSPNLDSYVGKVAHPHMGDRSHLWHMTPASASLLARDCGLQVPKVEVAQCWGDAGYCHPDNFVLWAVKP